MWKAVLNPGVSPCSRTSHFWLLIFLIVFIDVFLYLFSWIEGGGVVVLQGSHLSPVPPGGRAIFWPQQPFGPLTSAWSSDIKAFGNNFASVQMRFSFAKRNNQMIKKSAEPQSGGVDRFLKHPVVLLFFSVSLLWKGRHLFEYGVWYRNRVSVFKIQVVMKNGGEFGK